MFRRPALLAATLALLASFAATAQGVVAPRLPAPRIVAPEARVPVQIGALALRTTVAGREASTRLELTLANPNARALEATLEFPLAEGQQVSGFALDIQGELVPAVPVPKDQGRQVFDDVTRARVDPALLERTAGNLFRLRVFPVPAQGTRRVVLQISETLNVDARGRARWQLPLDFGAPLGRFDAEMAVAANGPVQAEGALRGARSERRGGETVLQLQRQAWQPREPLGLAWQPPAGEPLQLGLFEDRAYFVAGVPVDTTAAAALPLPRQITLVWDASGSGAQRDHAREFALLEALFAAGREHQVQLRVVRESAEPPQDFSVRGGDWRALRQALERVAYDGASDAALWAPPASDGVVLLFSDGLANWGEGRLPVAVAGGAPLHALSAATRADATRLRALAEARGGRFVDLARADTAAALAALTRPGLRLLDLQADGAEQLVAASVHPEGGRLTVAGVLRADRARVTLVLADAAGRRHTRVLNLVRPAAATADAALVPLAAQRWAALRLAQWAPERRLHRAEMQRTAQRFRLVSEETSLIVLENVDDYVRFNITPPEGTMRRIFEDRIAMRGRQRETSRTGHLDSLVRRFAERQTWWERDFPKDTPPPPPKPVAAAAAATAMQERADAAAMQRSERPRPTGLPPPPPPPAPTAMAAPAPGGAAPRPEAGSATASIALRPFSPDTPYARRLREARDEERYALYLDERGGFTNSTAFFIDSAELFFERKQTALAVRVLSNLAEMELENRQVLRILAYRLSQAGLHAQALPLLERVREIAPDEPQSWRDLGLALAAAGQPQRALEMLWEVASRPWDQRFADIDLIALAELNAIAARTPGLDTSRFDARLLRNLPLDLRAVLAWDADNTDIDLWVTDPNGERAYYGHRLSYQGGAVSRDFTGGYGPEEFALRTAKPGRYEVRAKFYGHRQQIVSPYTTLMLWLATGFGTAAQKDQHVVLRLSGAGQEVFVGSFEVEAAPK